MSTGWRECSRFTKKIVAHEPFLTLAVAPELGAAQVEDPPVGPPLGGLVGPVGLGEERHDFGAMGVHGLQPVFGGLPVMAAIDLPIGDEFQVGLELREEVVGGELAAGE